LKILVNTGTEKVSKVLFLYPHFHFFSLYTYVALLVVGEKICENYSAGKRSRKLPFVFDSVFQRSCQFSVHDIIGWIDIRVCRYYLLNISYCHFRRNHAAGMFFARIMLFLLFMSKLMISCLKIHYDYVVGCLQQARIVRRCKDYLSHQIDNANHFSIKLSNQ